MRKLSIVVALAFACDANAQQFDGTWTGTAGQWALTLTMTGTKARLEMACSGTQGMSDFAIGADGALPTIAPAAPPVSVLTRTASAGSRKRRRAMPRVATTSSPASTMPPCLAPIRWAFGRALLSC